MGVKWHGAGRRAVMVGALVAATLGFVLNKSGGGIQDGVIDPQVVLEKSKGRQASTGWAERICGDTPETLVSGRGRVAQYGKTAQRAGPN